MADLFLDFIRATRMEDWALRFQSAAEIVPWYSAYDHLNYARYLPVYIYEMLAVVEYQSILLFFSTRASCG